MSPLSDSIRQPLVLIIALSITLNVTLWLLVFLLFPTSDAAVLHYSIGIGIDFIGSTRQIYLLPAIGLIVLFGNTLLGITIKNTDIRSAWLLWSIIPPVHLILLGSFFLIWWINQ
ncbi:MAG TPA: hypothetical protein DDW41_04185 [Candidatus Andersenbacteria bacterium]|nr:MAG: hypothetical protein UW94_C0006G0042 [Parcubacteria group bacterium GW2011_GWA2_45_14]OGY33209.1 MAG: hypothetical protein A3B76_05020 [Candidatus Andersenbacteria bacterium RIFCSPHIGHO2_02_FULL_46_16]OGY38232.1 MAG: hypothetical protein A3I08_03600 [Candidatus Andersenbacteria bacterium RIFCSPLOWO2_02_FULL_46_11]HBE90378.1 hypothetical protein [Candidatus Andersenbacteria bacterium]